MDDLAELQLRLEVAFFLEVRLRYIGRQWRDLSQAKVASRLWRIRSIRGTYPVGEIKYLGTPFEGTAFDDFRDYDTHQLLPLTRQGRT